MAACNSLSRPQSGDVVQEIRVVQTVKFFISGHDAPAWEPTLEHIEGMSFIAIRKNDYRFRKFVCAASASEGQWLKLCFLDQLRALRASASMAASVPPRVGLFEEVQSTPARLIAKRARLQATPPLVDVDLPPIEQDGEVIRAGMRVRCEFNVCMKQKSEG